MTFIKRLQLMWRARTKAAYDQEIARLEREVEDLTYQSLGMLTRSWAGLEIMLDMINWAAAWRTDSRERFPVSLGRKVAAFRAAHNKLPELAAFRDEAHLIADQIIEASKTRHKLIHGFVQGEMHGPELTMLMHSVPKGENSHILYSDDVTVGREELAAWVITHHIAFAPQFRVAEQKSAPYWFESRT